MSSVGQITDWMLGSAVSKLYLVSQNLLDDISRTDGDFVLFVDSLPNWPYEYKFAQTKYKTSLFLIHSLLGYRTNKTEKASTTKKPWGKIEILDDPETVTKASQKPVDNDISLDKDVEELSSEALQKIDKKPEKITLYSSNLPSGKTEKLDGNVF